MAIISFCCPKCDAMVKLATRPAEGKKIKCTECSALFVAADNEITPGATAIQTKRDRPGSSAAAKVRPTRQNDDDDDDEDRPRKSKARRDFDEDVTARSTRKGSSAGLIIGLCVLGGGALIVAAVVVMGGVFWLLAARPEVQIVQGPPLAPPLVQAIPEPVVDVPVDKGPNVPPVKQPPAKKPKQAPPPPPVKAPEPEPEPEPEPAPVAPPVGMDEDILKKTTRATAFIRVDLGNQTWTGSGFVVKSTGDSAFIVTNYHVIAAEREQPKAAPKKGPGFGPRGFMTGPGGMFGPKKAGPAPNIRPRVTVVLYNGTPEEQALTADVVAEDEEADLATLRIAGARNLPDALEISPDSAVAERNSVYIFGFPGNKFRQGRPVLTVAKGAITTLRRDPKSKEVVDVHIDGIISPGNSGGPVVDAKGRLVGIAVATVPGKLIGFAIPAAELNYMFKGRLFAGLVFQIKQEGTKVEATGEAWFHDRKNNVAARDAITLRQPDEPKALDLPPDEYKIQAYLTDPLFKVSAPTMYFGQMDDVPAKPDAQGWTRIANSTEVPLKIQDQNARGKFQLPKGAFPDQTFAFQFSYVNGDGKTIFTQPHLARLTFPKNPKSVTLNISGIPDLGTRRFIEDMAPTWFAGKVNVKKKTNDHLIVEIDSVDDPKTIPPKIGFGEVKAMQGRTFLIAAKKIELPLPDAAEVATALDDLKSTDRNRRIGAADRLSKAYVPLPERRADVAKALEGLINDKDGWVGKAVLRALAVWAGPENIPAAANAIDNAFLRGEAVDVLTKFKDPAAATAIAKMLPWLGDRARASAALRAMGPLAEKAVISYVTYKEGFTQREACAILGEIGTAESIPALTAIIDSNNFFVSGHAQDALKLIRSRTQAKPNP